MAEKYTQVVIRKTGKSWGVYVDNKLVEGGFFSKASALACADMWRNDLKAFARHQATDPHCTCNDCMEDFSSKSE